ncbi:cell division protein FtsZ, partial [Thermodesulfobacteriota bacterium]
AAKKAISNPLLDDISIRGARGMLINITGSSSLTFLDLEEATNFIRQEAHDDANIIFGAAIDDTLAEKFQITVIATGFSEEKAEIAEVVQPQPQELYEPQPAMQAEPSTATQAEPVAVEEKLMPALPDIDFEKVRQNTKVVKIGTIISEFADDGEYDIPTFVRQQKSL